MLKKDSSIWLLRLKSLVVLLCCCLLFPWWPYLHNQRDLLIGGGIFYLLIAMRFVWIFIKHEQYWKRLSSLRLVAAEHAEQYLADKQLEPDRSALELPLKISIRPCKRFWLVWGVLAGIPMALVVGAIVFFLIRGQVSAVGSGLQMAGILIFIFCAYFIFTSTNDFCPTLTLDARGISAHYLWRRTFLAWPDAHLFAYYDTPVSAVSMQRLVVYELSGEQAFMHWSWSIFSSSWWDVQINGQHIDRDEYLDFINKFSQVVRGYTHLPLCDLAVETQLKA